MLLTKLLTGIFAVTCSAVALNRCSGKEPPGGFNPYFTITFLDIEDDVDLKGPCEHVTFPGPNKCVALERDSVAAQAVDLNMPAGGWTCLFYHDHKCEGESYSKRGTGPPLPDAWKRALGSFSCYSYT